MTNASEDDAAADNDDGGDDDDDATPALLGVKAAAKVTIGRLR